MTLCDTTFPLRSKTLTEHQLMALERLKGQLYGLRGFEVPPDRAELVVLYDASRLTLDDVKRALAHAGVPLCN